MTPARIIRRSVEALGTKFSAIHIDARNACVVFLSEGEDSLGTVAVSMPRGRLMLTQPLSSVLLGDRNATLARLIAERTAAKTGKLTLISVYLRNVDEGRAGPILLKLLDKVMRKEEETQR